MVLATDANNLATYNLLRTNDKGSAPFPGIDPFILLLCLVFE